MECFAPLSPTSASVWTWLSPIISHFPLEVLRLNPDSLWRGSSRKASATFHWTLYISSAEWGGERREAWNRTLCKKRKLLQGPLGLIQTRASVEESHCSQHLFVLWICCVKLKVSQLWFQLIRQYIVSLHHSVAFNCRIVQWKENVMQLAETKTNRSTTNYPIYL